MTATLDSHLRFAIAPPFTLETAMRKVRQAEDGWNSRNRSEFIVGRDQIRKFLVHKWERELEYRLVKALWGFKENRMAVRFQ